MHTIYQSTLLADAMLVRDMLVQNGIDTQLIEGESPYPGIGCSEVWVREEDRTRARALVDELVARPVRDSDWSCRGCRESNPGEFEVCWSCGAERTY